METPDAPKPETTPTTPQPPKSLKDQVVDVLKNTYDPEIPVNIHELGMIYECTLNDQNEVYVRMTLTTPACPVAGTLPGEVENKIRAVPGVKSVKLELVWEPAWNPSMMSEASRLKLGLQ